MGFKFEYEFKNLPKEGPPQTDIPTNPKISFMTALSNFCVANDKTLIMEYDKTGEPHMLIWTSTCTVDGEKFGTACGGSKKSADREAARQTLEMLNQQENLSSSRKYYPIFVDYLRVHGLEDRVEFKSTPDGPEHNRTWTCIVYLDGIEIGQGSSTMKKYAMEKASVSAASYWPSTKLP